MPPQNIIDQMAVALNINEPEQQQRQQPQQKLPNLIDFIKKINGEKIEVSATITGGNLKPMIRGAGSKRNMTIWSSKSIKSMRQHIDAGNRDR